MSRLILRSKTLEQDFTPKSLGGAVPPSRLELGPKKRKRKSGGRRRPPPATASAPGSGSRPRAARTSCEGGNESYVGEDETHAYGAGDDSDMDVHLVGCDAGVTEPDGRVSKEALKQNEKSEEWRADRAAHAHGASVFTSFGTSGVALSGSAAVTEALRVKLELAITSHFVPQALALLGKDDTERSEKWSKFCESIVDGTYKGYGEDYDIVEWQRVCYIEMNGNLEAEVPKRVKLLKLNNEEIELNAAHFGAFPSQPDTLWRGRKKDRHGYLMLWVDIRLLDHYNALRNKEPFVSHHHLVLEFSRMCGFPFSVKVLPNMAREYRLSIRPKVTNPLETLGILDVDECRNDPFQDCPVCAFVPTEASVSSPAYHMVPGDVQKKIVAQFRENNVDPARAVHSIQTDCCTKAVRLKVGAENTTLDTDTFVYFGDAVSTIPEAVSEAKYDSDVYACSQQIKASRAPGRPVGKTRENDKTVEQTLAAMVCKHDLCLRKSLRASKDPENFGLYHKPLIENILPHREPLNVCLDNACQCGPSFEKRHEDVVAGRPWMFWRTGSWHGAAHDVSCRLKFAMNFHQGAGTCDGEGTEKLWASLRKLWSTAKYMSQQNFFFIVEDAVTNWNQKKAQGLLEHFVDRLERGLPDKFDQKLRDFHAVIEEAKKKHGCDFKTLTQHAKRIFQTCANLKEKAFSSTEDDKKRAFLKSWLAHVEDVEFVKYFKGSVQADRGNDTPFGKLKKHSSELFRAAQDRIVTFREKDHNMSTEVAKKAYDDFVNVFISGKIATSRNAVDQMFSDRAALYSEIKRCRTGKGGRGEKEVRTSLKRNHGKIMQLMAFVDFWERRHAQLHGWDHSNYDRGHMKQWMGGDAVSPIFPLWRTLYKVHGNKDSGLISDADGCGSTSLWYLAFQYNVLLNDVLRIQEEVKLMEVEIERMKLYYDRRIRLLKEEGDKAVAHGNQALSMSEEYPNAEDGMTVSDILNMYPNASWPAFRNAYQRHGDIVRMFVEIQKSRNHCILNAHGKKLIEWAKKDWAGDQPVADGKKPRKRTLKKHEQRGHVLLRKYFPSQVAVPM
jgi:hypothetical protein